MKLRKRVLSMLLALVLCLGMLSGLALSADAVAINYRTGNPTPVKPGEDTAYTGVIANWGERGTVATYLSQNAESFYTSGNTYADFVQDTDSNAATEYNDGLYTALQTFMVSAHTEFTDYNSTRALYAYTDCENSDPTSISAFYSGTELNAVWDGGTTWNREHTWPNSKDLNPNSDSGDDSDDIMILRPEEKSNNSSRNNKAYGATTSADYFNPNLSTYDLRGDVARIVLYVYVRWGNTNIPKKDGTYTGDIWGADGVIESMDLLLDWMQADPVDTWELGRNDSVQSITGTRNVFVDYPELAFLLFNQTVPNMVTPSGEAAKQDNVYTVTPVSADTNMGTVAYYGDTITAFPAAGYKVAGYQVTAGTATVVQNGNAFTVDASSDCTVTIQFASNAGYQITFTEDSQPVPGMTAFAGDEITMPVPTKAAPQGYTFIGWVTGTVAHANTKPQTIYVPGAKYAPTGDASFYALYVYADDAETGKGNIYQKQSGAITDGYYLLESAGAAMKAEISNDRFNLDEGILLLGDQIAEAADTVIWKLENTSGSIYTIYNEKTGKYAAGTGAKNKGKLTGAASDKYATWEIKENSGAYVIENVDNRAASVNCTLRRNGTYGFAAYAATTGTGVSLYKLVDKVAVYTTTSGCPHVNTEVRGQTAASCTISGYTGDTWCLDCTTEIRKGTEIRATGHADAVWVNAVAATCKNEGTKGYYHCEVCNKNYAEKTATAVELTDLKLPLDPKNHVEETEIKGKKDATCGAEGYTGDIHCAGCGVKLADGQKIDAVSHSLKKVEAKAATHEAAGNIAHYACEKCGAAFEDEQGTKPLTAEQITVSQVAHEYTVQYNENGHWKQCFCGHKLEQEAHIYGQWVTVKEATLTETGSRERSCAGCGYKQSEKIEVLSTSPITGDISPVVLWIALAVISAGAVIALIAISKKKLNAQN